MSATPSWVELDARQRIVELVTRRGRAADAKDPDAILAERYLDRCAVHDGRWRLTHRRVVYDWSRSATPADDPRRSHD